MKIGTYMYTKIQREWASKYNTNKMVETQWLCVKIADDTKSCTIGVMGALNITHPNDLPPNLHTCWPLKPHNQIFWPPYHKSNKWRFGWLSHVIQGYQTGILHYISAMEKVIIMHLTWSSWCCYCSARPTLYNTFLYLWNRASFPS